MKHGLLLLTAITCAAPGIASAADQVLVEKLAPQIASRCGPDGGIPAGALWTALEASGLATLTAQGPRGPDWPAKMAQAAFSETSGPDEAVLHRLRRLTQTWVDPSDRSADAYLPRTSGGVSVSRLDGGALRQTEAEAVLAAIAAGDDAAYVFGCTTPSAGGGGSDGGDEAGRWQFAISREPADLLLDEGEAATPRSKKRYAEFAFLKDEVTDEDSYAIHATTAVVGRELFTPDPQAGPGVFLQAWPAAFLQYERKGSNATPEEDEVNNLSLGLQLGGFLQTRSQTTYTHYYALSARWLTDDRLDSEAWAINAQIVPDIHLPGADTPYAIFGDRAALQWLVAFTADHISVQDPGRKPKLQSAPEYTRVGYDVRGELRFKVGEEGAVALGGEYQLRDEVSDGSADAQIVRGSLAYRPKPNLSFGVVYERGENLDTLEFSHQWNLTIGIRR